MGRVLSRSGHADSSGCLGYVFSRCVMKEPNWKEWDWSWYIDFRGWTFCIAIVKAATYVGCSMAISTPADDPDDDPADEVVEKKKPKLSVVKKRRAA